MLIGAIFPLSISAQSPFKLEFQVGSEVYQAGETVILNCDTIQNVLFRVRNTSGDLNRSFCVNAVQILSLVGPGAGRVIANSKVENPRIIEGGCSFSMQMSTQSDVGYLFKGVYENIGGKKVYQKVQEKDRYFKFDCR